MIELVNAALGNSMTCRRGDVRMLGFDVIAAEGNGLRAAEVAALFRVATDQVMDAAESCSLPSSKDCYSVSEVARIRDKLDECGRNPYA